MPLVTLSAVPSLAELCNRRLLQPCEPASPPLGSSNNGAFSRTSSTASVSGADAYGGGPCRVLHGFKGDILDLPPHLSSPFKEVMAIPMVRLLSVPYVCIAELERSPDLPASTRSPTSVPPVNHPLTLLHLTRLSSSRPSRRACNTRNESPASSSPSSSRSNGAAVLADVCPSYLPDLCSLLSLRTSSHFVAFYTHWILRLRFGCSVPPAIPEQLTHLSP